MLEEKDKSYSYDFVYQSTLDYFNGDDLATNVWITKYCKKKLLDNGDILYYELTPDDMFHRIAKEISRAGSKYKNPLSEDVVYQLIKDFKYIVFQGRPMAGIGIDDAVSISNCFVVGKPDQDSYGTIALIDQEIMQLSKRGGGVGTDLSGYRPNGAKVHNAAMTSSGPVEICANRFSNTIREVGQNGRRGALMLSMDITHPSAEEFIDSKLEDGKITGANISVKLYDDWIKEALGIDCEIDSNKQKLWKKIIHNATTKAEPGVLFWDTVLRESVADCYSDFGFKTIGVNPCAELSLSDSESCRLMAINLYSYVVNPFASDAYFDYDLFNSHVRCMTKMMDNMIDLEIEKIDKIISKVNDDPEDEETKAIELNLWKKIKTMCIKGRRTGIGITGEGDMLAALGYKYGTPVASAFAQNIQKILALNVYIESCDLTQIDERPQFECFDYSLEKNNPFLNRLTDTSDLYNVKHTLPLVEEFKNKWKRGRRNIACLTIAPTGSLSCLTQTTSGIEPVFKVAYTRRRKIDKSANNKPDFIDKTGDWFINFNVLHNKFIVWYSVQKNISFADAKSILENCSESELENIIKMSPYYGATAMDCDWREKVRMQGMIQKYVDHSISVTINLPKGTTEETVSNLYEISWQSGCKGCTIYVDGSRDGVLISNNDNKSKCKELMEQNAPKRPKRLPCKIVRFTNKGEKWIAAVGLLNDHPYEIFSGLAEKLDIPVNATDIFIVRNKIPKDIFDEETGAMETKLVSRYDVEYLDANKDLKIIEGLSTIFNKEYWNYGKLISGLLRHGMPISYVIKVISSLDFKDDGINSWKNGVIRALKQFAKDEQLGDVCPNCGEKLWRVSGCIECKNCGYSKCG